MSERLPAKREQTNNHEQHNESQEKLSLVEQLEKKANQAAEQSPPQDHELLTNKASEAAHSAHSFKDRLSSQSNAETNKSDAMPPAHELKSLTYERNVKRIQSRLNKPDAAMSKVSHNKYVDFVSSGVEKTLGRQYGLLGAGIVGFFGTLYLYRTAQSAGFAYSYFAIFGLFAIGYVLGELLSIVIRLIKR